MLLVEAWTSRTLLSYARNDVFGYLLRRNPNMSFVKGNIFP